MYFSNRLAACFRWTSANFFAFADVAVPRITFVIPEMFLPLEG